LSAYAKRSSWVGVNGRSGFVHINTLTIQRVLSEPDWAQRMLPDDLRALTPLIYARVTPYGTFRIDMSKLLAIDQDAVAA
jgi:hypothetical protein